jgi:hypothetical protein
MTNILVSRYSDLNSTDVIKRRSKVEVDPMTDLNDDTIEGACLRIEKAWKTTFVPTNAAVEIIRIQIERAQAHAAMYYPTPQSLLSYGYADAIDVDPYMPTCLTGLAGSGKSQIQLALVRLLSGKDYTLKLDGHKPLPLTAFTRIAVSGHKSISQILRPLCRPEVANGSVRISEPQMPMECAQWRYLTGACLFSADEMQFLAQSREATTLVTQVLLAFAEVRTPWLFGANYSLCWKLLSRPSEATQRLLSRPVVLVPDSPGSTCWANVLEAYERVVPGVFGFGFKDRRFDLWNYTAGIKRELVSLLTHAYRLCRQRGAWEVQWRDVDRAYGSVEYSKSRDDVALLISHAAQGGTLRQDLLCPFVDDASGESVEQYKAELRNARANKVVAAAIDASMTVAERKALNTVSNTSRGGDDKPKGKVVKLRRGAKPTVASLQEAGRRFKEDKQP